MIAKYTYIFQGAGSSIEKDGEPIVYTENPVYGGGILRRSITKSGNMKKLWTEQYVILRAQLRNMRLKAKLTQQVLAGKLNKPQSYISKIESGERGCNLLEIRSICQACKVDFVKFVSAVDKELAKKPAAE